MITKIRRDHRQFQLRILTYGNSYYIERLAKLEKVLSKKPRVLRIDLIGMGEIPADPALLIRSALMKRSGRTRVIMNARSSLQGGSTMVWLLGDTRVIRDDARVFFRPANWSEIEKVDPDEVWKGDSAEFCDSYSGTDPEEGDYARVLEVINEFLPVNEMAGRLIGVPVLRQYGLVDNEQVDQFLATAFGQQGDPATSPSAHSEEKRIRRDKKTPRSRPVKQ